MKIVTDDGCKVMAHLKWLLWTSKLKQHHSWIFFLIYKLD